MDKSWIDERNRFSEKYKQGVKSFIEFAKNNYGEDNIWCPCRKCLNTKRKSLLEVRRDLHMNGFQLNYKLWVFHGENTNMNMNILGDNDEDIGDANAEEMQHNEDDIGDEIPEMLGEFMEGHENVAEGEGESEKFDRLLRDAERPIYPDCTKYSCLSIVVKLLHLKVMNKWSNKSVDMLLELLHDLLPEGNTLPTSLYQARRILAGLGLGYETIEVCKYDCVLFWKENKSEEKCPVCKEPRWKLDPSNGKKIPHKILRYFPLTPRLQRLFMSSKTSSDMRWHKDKRVDDENVLRHPADGEAWKDFDKQYPLFSQDPRNVRLGLATDGFNPFGNMSNSYSMWPVILTTYNLPPWLCMKEPFLMMSLLIPGPQAPGKDIDVYLRPLVDELRELWEQGVSTHDACSGEVFKMHAAVLWTINDFPAYGTLSGWSTKGYKACPSCYNDTYSEPLKGKIGYLGHRRYLPMGHPWRQSAAFNNKPELRERPKELSGEDVSQWLDSLSHIFDKLGKHPDKRKRKRGEDEANWTRKSILFELPYWNKLKLRHNLDVMHIEKNVCDNVIGTLLNIDGKTKDTFKAREDLRAMGIREKLHLQTRGNSIVKPLAWYTLTAIERQGFYKFLKSVKFPDGYAANLSRCVKDNKLSGMKTHDCHVLIQRLLPVGIRGYSHKDVREVLSELGDFFQQLCAKTLKKDDLDRLERNIPIILCKLEMIFPPAFFDIMVHLTVHLPREAKLGGPVSGRWMYPFERNLGKLKGHVHNRARPEGSIAEGYIVKECLTFISMYLNGIKTRFNQQERNFDGGDHIQEGILSVFSHKVRPFGRIKNSTNLTRKELDFAHWYVLLNCDEVEPYMEQHKALLQLESEENILLRQQNQFPEWFKKHMNELRHQQSDEATDELWALANGPLPILVKFYSGCISNEVRFHTKDRDDRRRTQNSGLVVEGDHNEKMIEFYGFLNNVIELTYMKAYKVVLFQCEWFDLSSRRTIQIDKHFVSINIIGRWYKDDPFVMPDQVRQVFYVGDTKLGGDWQVVQHVQHRHLWDFPMLEQPSTDEDVGTFEIAFQQNEITEVVPVAEDVNPDKIALSRDVVEAEFDRESVEHIDDEAIQEPDDDSIYDSSSEEDAINDVDMVVDSDVDINV